MVVLLVHLNLASILASQIGSEAQSGFLRNAEWPCHSSGIEISVRIRRLLYQGMFSNGVTFLELGVTREMFLRERAHDPETRRITRGQLNSLFHELPSNAHVLQRWWDHGVPDRHFVLVIDGVAQKGDGVPHAFFEMVNSHLIASLGF